MKYFNLWRAIAFLFCFHAVNAVAQPVIYLPFSHGTTVYCSQGNNGSYSHNGSLRYAYDFTFPSGTGSIEGEPVYSPVNGYVAEVTRSVPNNSGTGWGNTIVIQTLEGYRVRLAHLQYNSIPSRIAVIGHVVEQGDQVASVGATGNVTGPHLHIEIETRNNTASIPFEFVEGPVSQGTTISSDLRSDFYVIDNTGRINLGAPLVSSGTTSSGSFTNYSWINGAHLNNYRGSSSTGAQFNWNFISSFPGSDMRAFYFYTNCPSGTSRDTRTTYRVTASNGVSISKVIDQSKLTATNQIEIGAIAARTNTSFVVNARRGTSRMCADSILVRVSL